MLDTACPNWVVDPALKTVKVYRNPENGCERVADLAAEDDDTLTSPRLLGWRLPLRELFASAN